MEGRKYWRDAPEDLRERLRGGARRVLPTVLADEGVPVEAIEEFLTDELVEGVAAGMHERLCGDFSALVDEHVSEEEMDSMIQEEYAALSQEYPDGVPESVLAAAVKARLERERPAVRRWRWRGR